MVAITAHDEQAAFDALPVRRIDAADVSAALAEGYEDFKS